MKITCVKLVSEEKSGGGREEAGVQEQKRGKWKAEKCSYRSNGEKSKPAARVEKGGWRMSIPVPA